MKIDKGTAISFFDLWELYGYSTGQKGDSIHRNGYIDIPFISDCPVGIHIAFRDTDNKYFFTTVKPPYKSNSLKDLILSPHRVVCLGVDLSSVGFTITPQEDVMLKIFKNDDPLQNLYMAAYFPRGVTGYPKYYAASQTPQPSYGNIPGDENLFNETSYMRVIGNYKDECNLTDTTQWKTESEIKAIIETNNQQNNCYNFNKQGYQYKRSDNGHPTVTNATISWTVPVNSLVLCARKCIDNRCICQSFFFTPDTGECSGLNHVEDAMDKPPKAIHYILGTGN